jgi:hypothetical protein
LSVEETDGDFFLLEHSLHLAQPLLLRRRLLLYEGGSLLEEGAPLREAMPLLLNVTPLSLQHVMCLT